MKPHTHTWHRSPSISHRTSDVFFCRYPTCYKKIRLSLLNNKIAACPTCSQKFVVDAASVSKDVETIMCPRCSGLPSQNVQAQMLETIQSEAQLFLSTNYQTLMENLGKREKEIAAKELKLEEKFLILNRQRMILNNKVKDFRERMAKERTTLREEKAKFKKRIEESNFVYSPTTNEMIDREVLSTAIMNIVQRKVKESNEPNGSSNSNS